MRLRKPCEHDWYIPHHPWQGEWCPGGEFLAVGALVIEPGHEKEVALAILKDAEVLRRRVSGDRQIWETQWTWSDEFMEQRAAT